MTRTRERRTRQRPTRRSASDVDANGIRTNYLEAGSGDQTVVFVHGSGPGVTSYANWRGVLPALGENFRVVAPDMVGFGYSERPGERRTTACRPGPTRPSALMDALGIEKAHLVGNSFGGGIALRHRHQAPRPGRQAGADGQHGGPVPDHRGPRQRVGIRGHVREHAVRCMGYFAYDASPDQRRPRPGPLRGRTQPGFQESFSSMFPAPRQRWVESMSVAGRRDPRAAAPHADRARPRGPGHPARRRRSSCWSCIDNADLSVFSHCGHWSMIERTRRLQPQRPRLLPRR